MKGLISDIKRFAVHDGDGIRTTVFFKGCPLKCVWCHNPEGIDFKPQIAYYSNKCIGCGECVEICPNKAHKLENRVHTFNRDLCVGCGKCADVCLGNALTFYGKSVTVSELMPLLLEDREFYENSGGGVTLSGGECLMQADFCTDLLKQLKKENIHTAVDTCGFVPRAAIDKVIDYTDIFLYDMKAFDRDVHIRCTGQPNDVILDNLKYIDGKNKKTEIRIPFVPQYNDSQIEKISDFIKTLKNVVRVRVLPYHNYAGSKYESLGIKNALPSNLPDEKQVEQAQNLFNFLS
ncbi:MAG: glycyl-radical enzyme activating protein [bacterium]|nr:glycyl-radical enzyme activating protein [bacterium]